MLAVTEVTESKLIQEEIYDRTSHLSTIDVIKHSISDDSIHVRKVDAMSKFNTPKMGLMF